MKLIYKEKVSRIAYTLNFIPLDIGLVRHLTATDEEGIYTCSYEPTQIQAEERLPFNIKGIDFTIQVTSDDIYVQAIAYIDIIQAETYEVESDDLVELGVSLEPQEKIKLLIAITKLWQQ